MPRKPKEGLDFFYLQCDIFSKNSELRPLLRRYKADGLAVYLHILCDVYSNGYYYSTDDYEEYLLDLAEDCGITVEKVKLIVSFMQDRTLLRAFSLGKNTVLTSHGIQKHYVEAMKYRKHGVAGIKGEYWLLTKEEEAKYDTSNKSANNADKSEINADKSEINADKSEINAGKGKGKGNGNRKGNIDNDSLSNGEGDYLEIPVSEWEAKQADFYQHFDIQIDNYSVNLRDIDFNKLYSAYSQSLYLQTNEQARFLSWICRNYKKIVGGYYKDRPKSTENTSQNARRSTKQRKSIVEEHADFEAWAREQDLADEELQKALAEEKKQE